MKLNMLLSVMLLTCTSAFVIDPRSSGLSRTARPVLNAQRTEKDQRKPWDVFRFVSQSAKFVPTPFQQSKGKTVVLPGDILWRPGARENTFSFAPLDDVVMGGASSSNFDNVSGIWRGQVTDANNGGFIGIRNTPYFDWDMSKCRGLEFTVRKKGGSMKENRFKVGLRDSTEFNGIVWSASVEVKMPFSKIRVPLEKLKPTRFARIVPGEKLRTDNIVGIQFVYSKFEYEGALNDKFEIGDVDVQITEIRAY